MTDSRYKMECRVRVARDKDVALGPGKVELLGAIASTGSISAAARSMGMSYRRAWLLVETMNSCFEKPLVATSTGGKSGGGAQITADGERLLSGYLQMMDRVEALAQEQLDQLLKQTPLKSESS
jgi:molybdate transport system regulatory protein